MLTYGLWSLYLEDLLMIIEINLIRVNKCYFELASKLKRLLPAIIFIWLGLFKRIDHNWSTHNNYSIKGMSIMSDFIYYSNSSNNFSNNSSMFISTIASNLVFLTESLIFVAFINIKLFPNSILSSI